jgi:hypothetical protein
MEEKRAGGGDARSGAATEEIGRARRLASPCRYLAAAASAAEGFGWEVFTGCGGASRGSLAAEESRVSSGTRVRSGSRSGRGLLSEF